jgi:hypothetical protein
MMNTNSVIRTVPANTIGDIGADVGRCATAAACGDNVRGFFAGRVSPLATIAIAGATLWTGRTSTLVMVNSYATNNTVNSRGWTGARKPRKFYAMTVKKGLSLNAKSS